MANELPFEMKLISYCFITPKVEAELSKQIYNLSGTDLYLLPATYMHRGLLYKNATVTATSTSNLVEVLKNSISHALVHFYPLAGRLATTKYEDEHSSWIYVDCETKVGSGAKFIHAIAQDVSVSDIVFYEVNNPSYLYNLFELGNKAIVNHDGHTRALLSVQVTQLVDGVFIAFAVNHSLCDGSSLWHFINALSEIFLKLLESSSVPSSSICSRSEVVDISRVPIFTPTNPLIKLPYLSRDEFIFRKEMDPRLRLKIFHFSAETIAKLKTQANNQKKINNGVSSFQSLSAFVWRSITRARNVPPESHSACWLAADLRSRLGQPAGQFGNHVTWIKVSTVGSELLNKNNSLSWTANLLHQAVVSYDVESAIQRRKSLTENPTVAQRQNWMRDKYGHNPVLFSGSVRFDIYGPEFGLGKAVAVCSGYPVIQEGNIKCKAGRQGDGSVDLEMCLFSETMTALESDQEFMSYAMI